MSLRSLRLLLLLTTRPIFLLRFPSKPYVWAWTNALLPNFWLSEPRPLLAHTHLACAVHNRVHAFDHRLLQPGLHTRRLLCVALDDYLVVADKNWHSTWTLVPALPQESQRQLQAVGCGALDRSVKAVG
jgi:hypothetical protein